jgi:hypothetical protein
VPIKVGDSYLERLIGYLAWTEPKEMTTQDVEMVIRQFVDTHAAAACDAEGLPAWVADLGYRWRAVLLAGVGVFPKKTTLTKSLGNVQVDVNHMGSPFDPALHNEYKVDVS